MSLVRVQLPEPRIPPQNCLILRYFFDLTLSDLGIFRHTAIHPEIYTFLHSSYTESVSRLVREQTTGLFGTDKYKYGNPKVLPMKYTHFDDIAPNNRTEFAMLYFAAMRTIQKLDSAIRRTNGGYRTGHQAWLMQRLQYKLSQMSANYKTPQRRDTNAPSGAKYPTGIVIDLTGS